MLLQTLSAPHHPLFRTKPTSFGQKPHSGHIFIPTHASLPSPHTPLRRKPPQGSPPARSPPPFPSPAARPPPRRGAAGRRPLCSALACSGYGSDGGRRSPAASGDIFSGVGAAAETPPRLLPAVHAPAAAPPGGRRRRPGGALGAQVSAVRSGRGPAAVAAVTPRPVTVWLPEGGGSLCVCERDFGEESTTFGRLRCGRGVILFILIFIFIWGKPGAFPSLNVTAWHRGYPPNTPSDPSGRSRPLFFWGG